MYLPRPENSIITDTMIDTARDTTQPRNVRQQIFDDAETEDCAATFRYRSNVTVKQFIDELFALGYRVARRGPAVLLTNGDSEYQLRHKPATQYALLRQRRQSQTA